MQINKLYTYAGLCVAVVAGLFFAQSCKKTEYEKVKRPYNEIERFTIAGYGDLDSINAVISGDNILVYWNADAASPLKIRPVIAVSAGSTIFPGSGVEVNFSDTTTYTVTAEDGSNRKYKLKPVLNVAIPVLFSMPVRYRWAQTTPLIILGEYFFAAGDASHIKVYAQRIRDGFEFDLPIDIDNTSSTQITARLPVMTPELDTGAHRIYVKVGGFESNSMDVYLARPSINNDPLMIASATLAELNQPVKLGEAFTIVWNLKGLTPEVFEKFYPQSNITDLMLILDNNAGDAAAVELTSADYTVTGNQIKVPLGNNFNDYVGFSLRYIAMSRSSTSGESGGYYEYATIGTENTQIHNAGGMIPGNDNELEGTATLQLAQEGQQIGVNQELRVNYSFSSESIKNKYADNIDRVELIFRNTASAGGGRYLPVDINQWSDEGQYVTFKIPSAWQSTLRGSALAGIRIRYASQGEPVKYLNASVAYPTLNTLFIGN